MGEHACSSGKNVILHLQIYVNMASKQDKKIDKTEERIVAVEEAFSKTEQFIEKYQQIILIVVGVCIVVVLGFFGFNRFYLGPKEKDAQSQMFMAEKYFEQDSLKKALNGDGQYLGFLAIIDEFGMTKSANLSHYYAGICYLKLGQFDLALEQLDKFSAKDQMVGPMAKGAMGDANMELKQVEKAVDLYMDAAEMRKNEFTTPLFLMKAAMASEELGNFEKALGIYKRIKDEFPRSYEGREIDKYIAYAEGLVKK
jgi:tetratricopeptide (TPR) repeat protein